MTDLTTAPLHVADVGATATTGTTPATARTSPIVGDLTCSVVVSAFQRPKQLQRLIDGLASQTTPPNEVIIVDDGSAVALSPMFPLDSVVDWRLVRQANTGAGGARHRGITTATGDVIVIVDDDMIVDDRLIASHLDVHRGGADVVQGRFENRASTARPLFDRFIDGQQQRYFDECAADSAALDPVRLATGNVSFARSLYLRCGGFDTDLQRREDAELGLRFAAADARFGFNDASRALHDEPPEALADWLSVATQYGAADVDISARHHDHDPGALLAQMPRAIRVAVQLLGRSPRTLRAVGRAAASVGASSERRGAEGLALKSYGTAYALHWFAGVQSQTRYLAGHQSPAEEADRQQVHFGQVAVDVLDVDEAIGEIIRLTETGRVESVVTPNVDHLVRAGQEQPFRDFYQRTSLRLADGQPLILVSKLLGLPLRTKLSGSDLLEPVMRAAAAAGVPVFLFGSTEETAADSERRLCADIAGLNIVGRASPRYDIGKPTTPEFDDALDQMAASGARLVIVAFGSPKQERLLAALSDRLPPACYCCFGAALDFTAGTARRAPSWVSRCGAEWLWRLACEPRRLWRRYLVDGIGFFPIVGQMTIDRIRRRSLVSTVPPSDAPAARESLT